MSLPPAMPPDRDEARRRAAADPVLASAVRAADAAGVGECLDVETLGLYVDRVLRGAALVSARAHIDKCERCRSIVSFVEKADAGATGGAAHGAWAWLTGWRWLVPAASVAAVAAAAVWVNRSPANEGPAPTPEATVALTRPVEEPAPPVAARSALRDGLVGSATSAPALPGQEPARADEAAQSGTRQAMSSSDAREKARADGTSAAPNAGPPGAPRGGIGPRGGSRTPSDRQPRDEGAAHRTRRGPGSRRATGAPGRGHGGPCGTGGRRTRQQASRHGVGRMAGSRRRPGTSAGRRVAARGVA